LLAYAIYQGIYYSSSANQKTVVQYDNIGSLELPVIMFYSYYVPNDVTIWVYDNGWVEAKLSTGTNASESYITSYNQESYWFVNYNGKRGAYFIYPPTDFSISTSKSINTNEKSESTKCILITFTFYFYYSNAPLLMQFANEMYSTTGNYTKEMIMLFMANHAAYYSLHSGYYSRSDTFENDTSLFCQESLTIGHSYYHYLQHTIDNNRLNQSEDYYQAVFDIDYTNYDTVYYYNYESHEYDTILAYASITVFAVDYEITYTTEKSETWFDIVSAVGGMYSSIGGFLIVVLSLLFYGFTVSTFYRFPGIAYYNPLEDELQKRTDVYIAEKIQNGVLMSTNSK